MIVRITTLSENTVGRMGLLAEWGLSILIEADGRRVLLDTGPSFSAAYNAIALGVDLSRLDRIVFSHGHSDHTGGLLHILRMRKGPVEVIGHPDMWVPKYARVPGRPEHYVGPPFAREAAEALGATFNMTREPVWISENIVTSGEIPMTTGYEKVDPTLYVKEGGELKPDPLRDDQAVFVKSDEGLIVVSGCAHRGIINTIRYGQKLTGVEPVYAVIGGTHLISASVERVDLTIADLASFGVRKLAVSHCTGLPAAIMLARRFGEAFFFNNAGTHMEL
jgi:7,8-dihydropterin-6-yl-methyl-4-(beta-D-ribofuranosyl)aminobenzene 5'-phosphate synthase